MTHCSFSTVRERDMDLLFLEAIVTDPGFCALVLEKTDYVQKTFRVLDAQLSPTELNLGESDLTVILEIEVKRIGLLIEDKIDAITMPNLCEWYRLRGEKGHQKAIERNSPFIFSAPKNICIFSPMKSS